MTQLHHIREGQGPVIVLAHALGCDLGMWDGVAAALKDRYTVLRFDQRGHGRSETVPGSFGIEAMADDAAELIRKEGVAPVHFVGLSMGGMVAQSLAARHPALVKSIVIANSSSYYDDAAKAMWQARVDTVRSQGMAAISEGAMQRWFTPEFRADQAGGGAQQVAALRQRLEASDAAAYAAACGAVGGIDLRAGNAKIACPVLLIAGSRDEATPPAMSEAIASLIPGAKLRMLDAAHLSAVEKPREFARLVDEFIVSQG